LSGRLSGKLVAWPPLLISVVSYILSYFKNVKVVVLPAVHRCITEGKDEGENERTLPDR